MSTWGAKNRVWLCWWEKSLEQKEEKGGPDPGVAGQGLWAVPAVCARCPSPVPALSPCRNGYQKFSQELLSNGELNHLPLKERMVEIGSRWQRISQGQKDHYKKLAEEQQKQYKVHLDIWLKVGAGSRWGETLGSVGFLGMALGLVSVPAPPPETTNLRSIF